MPAPEDRTGSWGPAVSVFPYSVYVRAIPFSRDEQSRERTANSNRRGGQS